MNEIWYYITLLGEPIFWILFTLAAAFFYMVMRRRLDKDKKEKLKAVIVICFLSVLIAAVATASIKQILPVERPCIPCPADECNPYCPKDNSFPSGHTSATFAFFTALLLIMREKKYLPLLIIPVLVGISRIMLDVHFPIDVFIGALLGIIIGFLVFRIFRKKYNIFFE